MITILLFGIVSAVLIGICSSPADVLKTMVEQLSTDYYLRASYRELWMNVVPRGSYKSGSFVQSAFTIGRSEPETPEENWEAVEAISEENPAGACGMTYNQTYVGAKQNDYRPNRFGLSGPVICQDNLPFYWQSEEWWAKYFRALDKRNTKSIVNRLGNVYRQYSFKVSANANFATFAGDISTQPPPPYVDMSGFLADLPTSELTQEMLDIVAEEMIEEGAAEGDSDEWITLGPDGPQFPLNIGMQASKRIFINNPELRQDINQSFMGHEDANPVIKRIGASRSLMNFRHIQDVFPARWHLAADGETFNYTNTSPTNGGGGTTVTATVAIAGSTATITLSGGGGTITRDDAVAGQVLIRIPDHVTTTAADQATFGRVAVVNGVWRDPAVASYESAEVMNPLVVKEEVVIPINSLSGMKLTPQNYMGDWTMAFGNDALLGFDDCTGVTDPRKTYSRPVAAYFSAFRPGIPEFGRMILFIRCPGAVDTSQCS